MGIFEYSNHKIECVYNFPFRVEMDFRVEKIYPFLWCPAHHIVRK